MTGDSVKTGSAYTRPVAVWPWRKRHPDTSPQERSQTADNVTDAINHRETVVLGHLCRGRRPLSAALVRVATQSIANTSGHRRWGILHCDISASRGPAVGGLGSPLDYPDRCGRRGFHLRNQPLARASLGGATAGGSAGSAVGSARCWCSIDDRTRVSGLASLWMERPGHRRGVLRRGGARCGYRLADAAGGELRQLAQGAQSQ